MSETVGAAVHGGAPRGWLDLSANANPLGVPAEVRAAVETARYDTYGEIDTARAERHLAADAGVPSRRVLLTAGATEALRVVAAAFLRPGDHVLAHAPSYNEYVRVSRSCAARVTEVRATGPRLAFPGRAFAERLRSGMFRLAFLCDPNNPTGGALDGDRLRRIAAAAPPSTVLVVDQSFAWSAPDRHSADLVSTHGRTVIIRSLTKRLAAPGVRVGYVIAPPPIIRRLRAVQDPWTVGAHACRAAEVATWTPPRADLDELAVLRTRLARSLRDLGFASLPSRTSFVLVHVGDDAEELVRRLAARRIAVRWCGSFGLPQHVRIAVRPPHEQDALIAALKDIRGGPRR